MRRIAFMDSMVTALLAGRKTQTRRLVRSAKCHYGPAATELAVVEAWLWVPTAWSSVPWSAMPHRAGVLGSERGVVIYRASHDHGHVLHPRWRAARFMPAWAPRIGLLVTDIRKELVQSITEADAGAEGFACRSDFEAAWREIHGERGWESNPNVWAITFEVARCEHTEAGLVLAKEEKR